VIEDHQPMLFSKQRAGLRLLALSAALVAAGCAELKALGPSGPMAPVMPGSLPMPASADSNANQAASPSDKRELSITPLPSPPDSKPSKYSASLAGRDAQIKLDGSAGGEEVAAINLQQVPLPTFVQVIYAEILKRNVNIDPAVQGRKDLVTFRTGASQSAVQLDNAVKLLLKSYGIAAIDVGGLVRVLPDNAQLGNLPEIRRGEALPDTPLPLRPVFQLVELSVVRQTDVVGWLKTLFGSRITVQEDVSRNALLLSGTPDNMQAALEALRVLDQPLMAGRKSVALSPAYWSADDLAKRLNEVLTTQGYAVAPLGQLGQQGTVRYPVVLLPVAGTNAIYVFAANDEVLNHVTSWARTLDRPNERGIGRNYFTYAVKHKDASVLAKTLEQLLTGSRLRSSATATPAAGGAQAAASSSGSSSVVVDQSTNTLIFQVDADSYSQIAALLQTLDRPAKGALIEVTVAELTVDEKNQMGVEWLFSRDVGNGRYVNGSTIGGTGIGNSGFNLKVLDAAGLVHAALNALASNNQATILSSPRVLARNGEQATIQVGQEVPIITSQQTTTGTVTLPGQTGVLQTVQYRNTGVILKVKPVIHSGDQIDLEVQQEVSAAQSTNTGVNVSPTFSTRKLETKLTLRNGATVMMGGLISNNAGKGNAGVPYLKDLPLLGQLFGSQNTTNSKTELVVLITPYILNDSHDAETMTNAFRSMLGPWAQPAAGAASAASAPVATPPALPAPAATRTPPGN